MWSNRRSRRAARRRRGVAVAGKCILAGVLVLLIVLGVGADVWDWVGGRPVIDRIVHFRCLKCGYEYTKDLRDIVMGPCYVEPGALMREDCPKCGTAGAAIQLSKCPKCEKHYLPAYFTNLRLLGQPGSNICEHCKIDVDKWYMDEAKKRRKTTSRAAPRTRPQGGR